MNTVDQVFIGSIIETVYKDFCKLIRIVGDRGEFLGEFPIDISEEPVLNMEELPEFVTLVPVEKDVRESDLITAITPQFWTCNCKTKFVRHIGNCTCPLCGTHILKSTSRLPMARFLEEPDWAKLIGKSLVKIMVN